MNPQDEFDRIPGMPPWVASLLFASGIRSFDELASHHADTLAKLLREQVLLELTPWRIEGDDWIGQARALSELARKTDDGSDDDDRSSATQSLTPRSSPGEPRQLAGFTIFFDSLPNEPDGDMWRVRVYHDESGEEVTLPSIEPGPWTTWILSRALNPSPVDPGASG